MFLISKLVRNQLFCSTSDVTAYTVLYSGFIY